MLSTFTLFFSSFLLGVRHGMDWDHIAAISDITGTIKEKNRNFILGTLYALGHSLVLIILGFTAVFIGISLPDWVDKIMTPVVGITLIMLGFWLVSSMIVHGKNYKMKSRWMMVFALVNKIYAKIHQKISHKHTHPHLPIPHTYGPKTAFAVGMIHGVGAETPTQILLFISAAGAGGSLIGLLLVFAFVFGLVLSNSMIIVISVTGFGQAQSHPNFRLFIGWATAIFSFIVGILFIFNKDASL